MPTSELSDALNPHVAQARQRTSPNFYVPQFQPVAPPPQGYVPHRSELELAIPPPQPRQLTRPRLSPEGVHAVQELLRFLSHTREQHETERRRRMAWEQDIETRYVQRQADMERMMIEMRQEIANLRSFASQDFVHPQQFDNYHLTLEHQDPSVLSLPISPVSQPSSYHPSVFADAVSSAPTEEVLTAVGSNCTLGDHHATVVELPSPAPSAPQVDSAESPAPQAGTSTSTTSGSRRTKSPDESSSEEDNTDNESYVSNSERLHKRMNHHDKRCLTIQHAMRRHILLMMQLDSDKYLPDSHIEGAPLDPPDPVRFVWEKTAKQSVHNARMRTRILADLKLNRHLYKYVAAKDFNKKTMEAVFNQAFTTLRQKYRAQKDQTVALHVKKREDWKAMKARRLHRKKTKLANRSEARLNFEMFEHVTFDGAFQVECMSSEESDNNEDESADSLQSGFLRVHGYAWRSTRLRRFYTMLDDDEKQEKSRRPKRGLGKKERVRAPDKEAFSIPPKDVASWMISQRWLTTSQTKHPDLRDMLRKTVVDPPGFDWDRFDVLGEETDIESIPEPSLLHAPVSYTSSLSLANALDL